MKILMDASNVLFWRGDQAQTDLPEKVLHALVARRFLPALYFDHSITRYPDNAALDRLSDFAPVIIAPQGTPADKLLLEDCQHGRIQIITNDKFREWRKQHPRLRGDWLVSGAIQKGGRVSFSKKLRPAPL